MQQKIIPQHKDDAQGNPAGGSTFIAVSEDIGGAPVVTVELAWQDGPLGRGDKRVPANGLFVESLIAAVIDRVQYYQSKKFACRENALAITKLEEALHWLQARTARREAASIEGTHGTDATEARVGARV